MSNKVYLSITVGGNSSIYTVDEDYKTSKVQEIINLNYPDKVWIEVEGDYYRWTEIQAVSSWGKL